MFKINKTLNKRNKRNYQLIEDKKEEDKISQELNATGQEKKNRVWTENNEIINELTN